MSDEYAEALLISIYLLVSLIIWLTIEMTGAMAEARKNIVDGTSMECLIIIMWPLMLAFFLMLLPQIILGWAINKLSCVTIFTYGSRK